MLMYQAIVNIERNCEYFFVVFMLSINDRNRERLMVETLGNNRITNKKEKEKTNGNSVKKKE